jgi:hypothetical protein
MKPPQPATPEVIKMVDDCKASILSRIGKSEPCDLTVHEYTSRAVRGGNFCIKVSYDSPEKYIHVKINIMPQAILCGVRTDVTADTQVALFDDN